MSEQGQDYQRDLDEADEQETYELIGQHEPPSREEVELAQSICIGIGNDNNNDNDNGLTFSDSDLEDEDNESSDDGASWYFMQRGDRDSLSYSDSDDDSVLGGSFLHSDSDDDSVLGGSFSDEDNGDDDTRMPIPAQPKTLSETFAMIGSSKEFRRMYGSVCDESTGGLRRSLRIQQLT